MTGVSESAVDKGCRVAADHIDRSDAVSTVDYKDRRLMYIRAGSIFAVMTIGEAKHFDAPVVTTALPMLTVFRVLS